MKEDPQKYAREINSLVDNYLTQFPGDGERLCVLRKQLKDRDPALCDRRNLPGHLTASALLIDTQLSSILLIHHNFLNRWLQPGGHLEPGEDPQLGALRELFEEVGELPATLHPWHLHSLIPIDIDSHWIPASVEKQETEHFHHDFQYVFELDGQHPVQLQEAEVSDHQWVPVRSLIDETYGKRLARSVRKSAALGLVTL